MCRKLPSDAADFVMEAVPLLTNLLNYHDSKVDMATWPFWLWNEYITEALFPYCYVVDLVPIVCILQ